MALTAEQIIDRMKLKKQLSNWRLIAVITLLITLMMIFSPNDSSITSGSLIEPSYIARIHVRGIIVNDSDRLEILKEISENTSIKAVIVQIDSPGGTVVGGENLYNTFRKISVKKPTVALMGDVAASAAYMTAIGTDRIFAHQGTITGSIGVLGQSFEVTELANKVGIEFHHFKSSPLKGGPIPTEHMTEEMRESMMDNVKDIYQMFYSMVAERRNIPDEKLKQIADGRTFTGRQALKLGLIDEIGDEDAAKKWLEEVKKINNGLKIKTIELERNQDKFLKFIEYSNNFMSVVLNMAKNGSLIFL